jgi:DNA-binding XRE family transcriptional regulator
LVSAWREEGDLNCWIWQGRVNDHGTPEIRTPKGHTTARRHLWERTYGLLPKGLILYSHCGEKQCVRPRHAEPVTWSEWCLRTGRSKLDQRRAAMALLMRERGVSRRKTAAAFGVDRETIRAIEDGTHWTQRKAAA